MTDTDDDDDEGLRPPIVEMVRDGSEIFVVADGLKIAKRGHPGTAQAKTWISLEPGWVVFDHDFPTAIAVEYNGALIH